MKNTEITSEMTNTEIEIVEPTIDVIEETMFDRFEKIGTCFFSSCETPKENFIKKVSINGFVSLHCPNCGNYITKYWFKLRFPNPDIIRKKQLDWIVK